MSTHISHANARWPLDRQNDDTKTVLTKSPTRKPGWTSRLILPLAILLGVSTSIIYLLLTISCQSPSLSDFYLLKLQDSQSSNEARFGYFGVCTTTNGTTTCLSTSPMASDNSTTPIFLSLNTRDASLRLTPLFTPLLLISSALSIHALAFLLIHRFDPASLQLRFPNLKTVLASSTLVCAWLSSLLTWMAAIATQQVATSLSMVTASQFDTNLARYTFTSGSMALSLHWGLATLVTLFAVTATAKLLAIGTLDTEQVRMPAQPAMMHGAGVKESYFEWEEPVVRPWSSSVKRGTKRGSAIWWAR